MEKFMLHRNTCDKHDGVNIEYDGSRYQMCPLCVADDAYEIVQEFKDRIENSVRDAMHDADSLTDELRDLLKLIQKDGG